MKTLVLRTYYAFEHPKESACKTTVATGLDFLMTSFLMISFLISYYSSEKDLVYLNYIDSVLSKKYKEFYQCNKIKKDKFYFSKYLLKPLEE